MLTNNGMNQADPSPYLSTVDFLTTLFPTVYGSVQVQYLKRFEQAVLAQRQEGNGNQEIGGRFC
mgnify:CR=1 FL=1